MGTFDGQMNVLSIPSVHEKKKKRFIWGKTLKWYYYFRHFAAAFSHTKYKLHMWLILNYVTKQILHFHFLHVCTFITFVHTETCNNVFGHHRYTEHSSPEICLICLELGAKWHQYMDDCKKHCCCCFCVCHLFVFWHNLSFEYLRHFYSCHFRIFWFFRITLLFSWGLGSPFFICI